MNKQIISGNVGGPVELRATASGQSVANFTVATNEYGGKDESGKPKRYTTWHRVVVWGKQADNCAKYLSKGRQVLVEGRTQHRKWTDKDGVVRYTTEVVANQVQFLGAAPKADENAAQEPQVDDDPQMDIPNFESEF